MMPGSPCAPATSGCGNHENLAQTLFLVKNHKWTNQNDRISDIVFFPESNTPNPCVEPNQPGAGVPKRASHLRMFKSRDLGWKHIFSFLVKLTVRTRRISDIVFFPGSNTPNPCVESEKPDAEVPVRASHLRMWKFRDLRQNAKIHDWWKWTVRNGWISDIVFFPESGTPTPYVEPEKPGAGAPMRASHLRMLKCCVFRSDGYWFFRKIDHLEDQNIQNRIFSWV